MHPELRWDGQMKFYSWCSGPREHPRLGAASSGRGGGGREGEAGTALTAFLHRHSLKPQPTAGSHGEPTGAGRAPDQICPLLTIFVPWGLGAPMAGVRSCLATASRWVRFEALRAVRLPSSLMTMEAPGCTLGPLMTACLSS